MNINILFFVLFISCVNSQSTECPSDIKQLCKNGATCTARNGNYYCICAQGFTGVDCSIISVSQVTTQVTTAASITTTPTTTISSTLTNLNPIGTPLATATPCPFTGVCKNGGSCFIINDNIKCFCVTGYEGAFCETPATTIPTTTTVTTSSGITSLPTCNPVNSCKNGATCYFFNGIGEICQCTPRYTGRFCDIDLSTTVAPITASIATTTTSKRLFCDSNPCKNGAACVDEDNFQGFCVCKRGYYGLLCETQGCDPNPCQKSGICKLDGKQPVCECPASSVPLGEYCENKIDESSTNSASFCDINNCGTGTCVRGDGLNGKCFCADDTYGLNCEATDCTDTLCKNGGTCYKSKTVGVKCICAFSYTGEYCEKFD